jgi:hypothetical protein
MNQKIKSAIDSGELVCYDIDDSVRVVNLSGYLVFYQKGRKIWTKTEYLVD